MEQGQISGLGILILLAGLVLVSAVWYVLRWVPRARASLRKTTQSPTDSPAAPAHEDAILVLRVGGRAEYMNAPARAWFGFQEEDLPNLEQLARRVKPVDQFLSLCAGEGQARFSIEGRVIEGTSYLVPGAEPTVVVTMRRPELAGALVSGAGEGSAAALKIIAEFGQTIAARLDLEATVEGILENVENLVYSNLQEIKILNSETGALRPFRAGKGTLDDHLEVKDQESQFGQYHEVLLDKRKPLFIPDTSTFDEASYSTDPAEKPPFRSYIGLPLVAAGELVGTLEIGSIAAEAFSTQDMGILQLVIGQAATAIRNAMLYEDEQRRSTELSGLSSLAQSIGSMRDADELFEKLVESIISLFDVDILGFLTYNETTRILEGQSPFRGMADQFVGIYKTRVQPGSQAEAFLQAKGLIYTENASEDERWKELGLQELSQAASIRDTTLVPLTASGRPLGFLQLSNHSHGAPLTDDELRLLGVVAGQAAAIIENALLIQQSRQRIQRSESLRRIANLTTSTATVDEILRYVVQELGNLLQSDAAAVFLLDEKQGTLRLHQESLWGVTIDPNSKLARLNFDAQQFHVMVSGSLRPFMSGNLIADQRVLPVYREIVNTLKMESAAVVPLVVRNRGIGELMLGSQKQDHFDHNDLQLMATAAGQLASAVENATSISDEGLRRRVDQLMAVTRINRELNIAADIPHLLKVIYNESLIATRADCGTVLAFQVNSQDGSHAVTDYVGDDPGKTLPQLHIDALQQDDPLVVQEFSLNGRQPEHAGMQAAVVTPIAYQGETLGIIAMHAREADRFDEGTVEVIQQLAVQSAIALGNARRYREQLQRSELLRRRAETVTGLLDAVKSLGANQPLERSLEAIAQAIQDATPFDVVLLSVFEPDTGYLRRVAGAGIPEDTFKELVAHQQPWQSVKSLLRSEFQYGQGYFIPFDQAPVVPPDVHMVTLMQSDAGEVPNKWHPDDMLLYPLYRQDGSPLGMLSLDHPRDGMRPDRATLETLDIFAGQASLTIDSGHSLLNLSRQVERYTGELDRQKKLLNLSQGHLPILLHKDIEQTIAVRHLQHRTRRVRAGLMITESISRQLDASSALLALGREVLTQLGMTVSLVAEDAADGPRLLHVLGSVPKATNPESLFGQRNPLRYSIQTGETLLVADLDQDATWRETPLLNALNAKSFICLPIVVAGKPVAGVMAASQEPLSALTDEDRQVYHQISRQVSVILQNIGLLGETRLRLQEVNLLLDFSRQLSGLSPDAIVRSLLASALRVVSGGHAGVVLLWSEKENRLTARAASNYADDETMMEITYHLGEALPGEVMVSRQPRRVDEVHFAADYNLPAENLLRYRKATAGRLPVSSLIVPIQTSERILGVIVLDNFNTTSAFSVEDEALLQSLTQQVALSLENVRLVQASQTRAAQLQALNNVAATLTSSLKREDLVNSLLEQLQSVLPYDTAILWLRSEDKKHLTVAAAQGFDDNEERVGLSVAVQDSILLNDMIAAEHGVMVGDVRQDARFPSLVEATYLSWMGVPLIASGEVIGVIAMEKEEAYFFTQEQFQLAATFAGQAAVALENAYLYEDSVRRAVELDQRSQRLALLNRFSSNLGGALDAEQVLKLTAQELVSALNASQAKIVSISGRGSAFVQYTIPEPEALVEQHLADIPLFEQIGESLSVFTSEDVQKNAELSGLGEFLTGTRSLMILPLPASGRLWALFLMMSQPYHFSPTEIELARTISYQAAIALDKAYLFESTRQAAEQMTILNQVSFEIGSSLKPEDIYIAIEKAVSRLMPVDAFAITLLDEQRQDIEAVYITDFGQRVPNVRLKLEEGLSGRIIESGEAMLLLSSEQSNARGAISVGERGTPESIVAVPLVIGSKVMGMLSAQSYAPKAYSADDLQLLGTLANQAVVAIQNARLFAESQQLAEELEERVGVRTAELEREQHNTATLLRILSEVSSSLDLDRALNRTLALLNDATGAEQGTILLLHAEDNMLHYRAGYGYLSSEDGVDREPLKLKIGQGLAGWVVKNRVPVLVPDLHEDPRWVESEKGSQKNRSAAVAPLVVGEEVIGAIMVFHRNVGYFTKEAMKLVQAIGAQVAIAINNAQLYELIRDQAERLGAMLRRERVEASRQQAILESVADGVLVTDANNSIDFINTSAERILNLDAREVTGKGLEDFAGLFGKAARTWIDTIRQWSDDPLSRQSGETYAEQLSLDEGRVVLVHLAPVAHRNEFLGTVSIFRDITHEVEVDRLKSEFVATVSHELRTPMTSIRGYVDVLLMGAAGMMNDNQVHFLNIVKSNTERLNVLVNDLLDVSRIEAGRVTLSMQPLDMREIADDIIADVERRSVEENKPMSVEFEPAAELPRVLGDSERVRQILGNLVDNAYHYTPINGQVTIRIYPEREFVRADISDNGIGIPPEYQSKVFERFYRGEDPLVLATPGTGLGLSITKQLVEMHQGHIWVESLGVPGMGSTFSFTLPVYRPEEN